MGWVLGLAIYLFGGVTFIPLVIYLLFVFFPKEKPSVPEISTDLRAGEIEEHAHSGLDTFKEGWIIVTQTYVESTDQLLSSTQTINESETKSAYSSLYKIVQKDLNTAKENDNITTSDTPVDSANGVTPTPSNKRHRYYAVLKHGNLFLYKNETLKTVLHVIVLSNHIVTIWPPNLLEAQLFTKYSAIAIIDCKNLNSQTLKSLDKPPKKSFFIYTDIASEKEDWWFDLIRATKQQNEIDSTLNPNIFGKTLHFKTKNMIDLIQTLYSNEGQLQTKWLNGLLGRMFLGLQQTEVLKNYIHEKLTKKLNKIKRPGFLDAFQITHVDPGDSAPHFTYPTLREISPDGTIIMACHLTYTGNLSIHIATKVNINIGIGFKNREVDVVLKITLKKFQGPLLFKIKPPPSERIWYTYETDPLLELKIEPVISSRNMNFNIITNSIHKKFEEGIKESLVLPHWDDICFYETVGEIYRGGIWDKKAREEVTDEKLPKTNEDDINGAAKDSTFIRSSSIDQEETIELNDVKKVPSAEVLKLKSSTLSQKLKSAKAFGSLDLFEKSNKSLPEQSSQSSSKTTLNTIKKIGKWYFKDGKTLTPEEEYHPPEMISNRRQRRASSIPEDDTLGSITRKASYEFGKSLSSTTHTSIPESTLNDENIETDSLKPEDTVLLKTPTSSIAPSFESYNDDVLNSYSEEIHNDDSDFDTSSSVYNAKSETLFDSIDTPRPVRRASRKPPPSSPI